MEIAPCPLEHGTIRAMIVAGIDEAGYGPLLGPLVVGCCAFEAAAEEGQAPCLWKRLNKYVSRNRLKTGRKIHVNDSKAVYSSSTGLRELERSVLALAAAADVEWDDLHGLLRGVAPDALEAAADYDWYRQPRDEAFPLEQEALPLRLFARGLASEMRRTETRCVMFRANVVFERQLNRMIDATRSKGSVLFTATAVHLERLLNQFGDQELLIVCDRHGGRAHYGSLLRLMFDSWSLEIVGEAESRSEYALHRGGHTARIVFVEKAEAQCMSVAIASMISKYLREAMMRRFNAFWQTHLPDVSPTAGYYSDGTRFLADIDAKRRELNIADAELIRCR